MCITVFWQIYIKKICDASLNGISVSDLLAFAECENKKNSSAFLSASEFFYDEENIKKYQQHVAWNGEVGNSVEDIISQQACSNLQNSGVWHVSSFLLDGLAKRLVR